MMSLVATAVLFLVLASSNAAKYLHPFHHYHQEKDPYPPGTADSNEDESAGMLSRLAFRLRSASDEDGWEEVPDPRMYVLTEPESPPGPLFQDGYQEDLRTKRKGPSLSIVNPLEVLQEKWLMELNRRQKAGLIQINTIYTCQHIAAWDPDHRNRQFLSSIGKRSAGADSFHTVTHLSQLPQLPQPYQT